MPTITTIDQAHALIATIPADFQPPHFPEYMAGLEEFLAASADWYGLDDGRHYVADRFGHFVESWDNAEAGLDVSWAFHKSPTAEEIRAEYLAQMDNLHEILEEAGDD